MKSYPVMWGIFHLPLQSSLWKRQKRKKKKNMACERASHLSTSRKCDFLSGFFSCSLCLIKRQRDSYLWKTRDAHVSHCFERAKSTSRWRRTKTMAWMKHGSCEAQQQIFWNCYQNHHKTQVVVSFFSKKRYPPHKENSGLRQMIWRISKFRKGFVSDRWVFCGISKPSTGFQKHLKRPCYKASYQNPALKGGCWPPFSFAKLRIWLSANDDILREYPLNALCQ